MTCSDSDRKHLIDPVLFAELARPSSNHLDDDEVWKYIDEVENTVIIPAIGYGNFEHAVTIPVTWEGDSTFDVTFDGTFDDLFEPNIWLNGGSYETCGCGCESNALDWCVGLRKTVAYYVYAKLLRADGTIVARAGAMRHNDNYANHVDPNRKQYDDVMNVAEQYLSGCMKYARCHTVECRKINLRQQRAKIRAIGD